MTRCAFTVLIGVLVAAMAWSSMAAEAQKPDKKKRSPKQATAREAVTAVIDKVLVKQQQIVVTPQTGIQIQTQAAATQLKASDPLTIRVDRNTEITGPAVETDELGKGQPKQQDPVHEKAEKPESEDPSQAIQQQKPKQAQQAPHPIALLAKGQLVRVVYVQVVRKLAAPRPAKQEQKPQQQTHEKADEDAKKHAPPVGQLETKDETAQQTSADVSEKTILRAVSVEILQAADPDQKAKEAAFP